MFCGLILGEGTRARQGSTGVLYSLSWSPDGTLMASSSSEGKIFIYDVEKGVVVRTVQTNKEASARHSSLHV